MRRPALGKRAKAFSGVLPAQHPAAYRGDTVEISSFSGLDKGPPILIGHLDTERGIGENDPRELHRPIHLRFRLQLV